MSFTITFIYYFLKIVYIVYDMEKSR